MNLLSDQKNPLSRFRRLMEQEQRLHCVGATGRSLTQGENHKRQHTLCAHFQVDDPYPNPNPNPDPYE